MGQREVTIIVLFFIREAVPERQQQGSMPACMS